MDEQLAHIRRLNLQFVCTHNTCSEDAGRLVTLPYCIEGQFLRKFGKR
jgi:hypothetical protein